MMYFQLPICKTKYYINKPFILSGGGRICVLQVSDSRTLYT